VILPALPPLRWQDAVDVLVAAIVIYRVLVMFKGTRAVQMLAGVGLLMGATVAARRLELAGTGWILENLWSFWVIALVVLFQPELRRALAHMGRGGFLPGFLGSSRGEQTHTVDEVVRAVDVLAARRIGALIVFERATGLRHYAELGIAIDALVSADLLESLFVLASPLHDGAVFIQANRVVAAGCFLPLSRTIRPGRALGTRHRAALGISEETDAVAVVVSEETGRVSLAADARMDGALDGGSLHDRLAELLGASPAAPRRSWLGVLRRRALLRPDVAARR
jgi:diadenylate cyclase